MTDQHEPGNEFIDEVEFWQERVRRALRTLGRSAKLEDIHRMVEKQDPSVRRHRDWKDNVWNAALLDPDIGVFEDMWELLPSHEDE